MLSARGGSRLRNKDRFTRRGRHEDWGKRHCVLILEGRKWLCLSCSRYYKQRFPDNRSRLGRREGIGAATVERYFRHGLKRQFAEWHARRGPRVLGIDEHFFTRKKGFATTLCG